MKTEERGTETDRLYPCALSSSLVDSETCIYHEVTLAREVQAAEGVHGSHVVWWTVTGEPAAWLCHLYCSPALSGLHPGSGEAGQPVSLVSPLGLHGHGAGRGGA